MKTKFRLIGVLLFSFALAVHPLSAQQMPRLPERDRIRIAEAFRIGQMIGNRVWKDWDKAPFAVLLVTDENEFLIRHPKPSKDFTSLGYDSLLQSDVYYRKRVFSPNLLATFPAVGGIATIVIGQAENTSKKTSTAWVVTMLHEHFHQLQFSQPSYYPDADALNLSGDDKSGSWSLNYAFPYSSPDVKQRIGELARLLGAILQIKSKKEFSAKVEVYLKERRKLEALLKPNDYKYLSFQLWQEGVARHTEYRIAELAGRKYKPSKQFRGLKDYQAFNDVAGKTMENILKELAMLNLDEDKRVAFYPMGAGEALLLDRANPKWKERYFTDKFYLNKYFEKNGNVTHRYRER